MFEILNNRVFRVDGKYVIMNNIFGAEPKQFITENLDQYFNTIYQVQTAKDCIETFAGLVNSGAIVNVNGRTHFDAVNGKIIIELQGETEANKQTEPATEPERIEPVVEKEPVSEEKPVRKTKKSKKESK